MKSVSGDGWKFEAHYISASKDGHASLEKKLISEGVDTKLIKGEFKERLQQSSWHPHGLFILTKGDKSLYFVYDDYMGPYSFKELMAVKETPEYSRLFQFTDDFPEGNVKIAHNSGVICFETKLEKISFSPTPKQFKKICSRMVNVMKDCIMECQEDDGSDDWSD